MAANSGSIPPPPVTVAVHAPAKLNLFLHVTGRRPDGYHILQTAFQILDYADQLFITPRDDSRLSLSCVRACPQSLVDDASFAALDSPDNLVLRAAQSLQVASNTHDKGADIVLHKRIPIGGGLGGGSADAAAVLVALNRLWNLDFSPTDLAALGGRLGADIPVLVLGQTSWGEGSGKDLSPLVLPSRIYLVIYPSVSVLTVHIFSHPDLVRSTPPITRADYESGKVKTCNNLQPVAEALYPPIAVAVEWLGQFSPAVMTGSGSCVFSTFESLERAESVLRQVPQPWGAFIAKGVNEWDHFKGNVA
ncbi:4-diphosphocytidyl-2-C-methyl-D-erythritol kinase [Russula compacta]|nr:4-diphosphocytidyl-2-C-methyl-D-erythritol kinase [Russula compacta]